MTRARYRLTVPGPSYPWFCRALVGANHGHLIHPDGTRHPQQVTDAKAVAGGTLVEFEAEIPTNLLDRAATRIDQPEPLPTEAERARGWGAHEAEQLATNLAEQAASTVSAIVEWFGNLDRGTKRRLRRAARQGARAARRARAELAAQTEAEYLDARDRALRGEPVNWPPRGEPNATP